MHYCILILFFVFNITYCNAITQTHSQNTNNQEQIPIFLTAYEHYFYACYQLSKLIKNNHKYSKNEKIEIAKLFNKSKQIISDILNILYIEKVLLNEDIKIIKASKIIYNLDCLNISNILDIEDTEEIDDVENTLYGDAIVSFTKPTAKKNSQKQKESFEDKYTDKSINNISDENKYNFFDNDETSQVSLDDEPIDTLYNDDNTYQNYKNIKYNDIDDYDIPVNRRLHKEPLTANIEHINDDYIDYEDSHNNDNELNSDDYINNNDEDTSYENEYNISDNDETPPVSSEDEPIDTLYNNIYQNRKNIKYDDIDDYDIPINRKSYKKPSTTNIQYKNVDSTDYENHQNNDSESIDDFINSNSDYINNNYKIISDEEEYNPSDNDKLLQINFDDEPIDNSDDNYDNKYQKYKSIKYDDIDNYDIPINRKSYKKPSTTSIQYKNGASTDYDNDSESVDDSINSDSDYINNDEDTTSLQQEPYDDNRDNRQINNTNESFKDTKQPRNVNKTRIQQTKRTSYINNQSNIQQIDNLRERTETPKHITEEKSHNKNISDDIHTISENKNSITQEVAANPSINITNTLSKNTAETPHFNDTQPTILPNISAIDNTTSISDGKAWILNDSVGKDWISPTKTFAKNSEKVEYTENNGVLTANDF